MNKSLQYPANVFFSEQDEGYIAVAPDLAGCSAFGDSPEEALHELQDAIAAWIEAAKKVGNPIPKPSPRQVEELPSGKVLLRLPKTLHAQLIDRANLDGTSLNTCLVMLLSQALAEKQGAMSAGPSQVLTRTTVDAAQEVAHAGLISAANMTLTTWHSSAPVVEVWAKTLADAARHSVAVARPAKRTLVQGGSILNVRTLPANKPVIYSDDENG